MKNVLAYTCATLQARYKYARAAQSYVRQCDRHTYYPTEAYLGDILAAITAGTLPDENYHAGKTREL